MFNNIKIWLHQGKQFIPDVRNVKVPGIFRGRPVISTEKVDEKALVECCPVQAISTSPVSIDLGRCTFCGECAMAFPQKVTFTKDYKMSTNDRQRLIIKEGVDEPIELNKDLIPKEFTSLFGSSLKLRQVSAGGDNSCEWELNAANKDRKSTRLKSSH